VYEWNGSSAVLIGSLGAGSSHGHGQRIGCRCHRVFYITLQRDIECIDGLGERRDAEHRDRHAGRPVSPRRPSPALPADSPGRLSSGATGYQIYYLNGSQAVSLGSVGSSHHVGYHLGHGPGTTYEFMVRAYNSTSQASSQWTALTTLGSPPTRVPRRSDTDADLTMVADDDSSSTMADSSLGLLPAGVTFNQAAANGSVGNPISGVLAASVFRSTAAVESLVRATLPSAAATTSDSLLWLFEPGGQ